MRGRAIDGSTGETDPSMKFCFLVAAMLWTGAGHAASQTPDASTPSVQALIDRMRMGSRPVPAGGAQAGGGSRAGLRPTAAYLPPMRD